MKKYRVIFSKERVKEAKERLQAAKEFRIVDRVPFVYNIAKQGKEAKVDHQRLATDDEYDLHLQIEGLNYGFRTFPDCDRIPGLGLSNCGGENAIPSMFGVGTVLNLDNPPYTWNRIINNLEEDLPKLKRPDPTKDGLIPGALKRLRYFIAATDGELPCSGVDHQSPFGLATKLIYVDKLILEMYDHPELVKKLLDIIADAIIDTAHAVNDIVKDPEFGKKSILWDDYVSVLSPDLYKEFCIPVNAKVYNALGSPGHLHTCGPYFGGFIDSILAQPLVNSIDLNFIRGQTRYQRDIELLKKKIRGKLCCYGSLCDYGEVWNIKWTPEVRKELNKTLRLDFLKFMNQDGGLIWAEDGNLEDGLRFLQMAKDAVK